MAAASCRGSRAQEVAGWIAPARRARRIWHRAQGMTGRSAAIRRRHQKKRAGTSWRGPGPRQFGVVANELATAPPGGERASDQPNAGQSERARLGDREDGDRGGHEVPVIRLNAIHHVTGARIIISRGASQAQPCGFRQGPTVSPVPDCVLKVCLNSRRLPAACCLLRVRSTWLIPRANTRQTRCPHSPSDPASPRSVAEDKAQVGDRRDSCLSRTSSHKGAKIPPQLISQEVEHVLRGVVAAAGLVGWR